MEGLTDRQKQVLEAVIGEYTRSAEPVGSRTLSRKYLRLSPATVRNVLADLEEMGLLSQPHTSAGRVPTERAYRAYIDGMMELRPLPPAEQDRIRADFESRLQDGRDLMKRTSHLLSAISSQVGLVVAPRLDDSGLKRVELVRAGKGRVMAVIILDRPLVQHRMVETETDSTQVELDRMSRTLNAILSGLNLRQVRARIEEEMRGDKAQYDRLLAAALRVGRDAMAGFSETDLYVEEPARILDQPEFLDVGHMKALFHAFEEKSRILRLLDEMIEAEGVRVVFGSALESAGMRGCSLIASRYTTGPRATGSLGVIGPTRMNYARVIPVVDYVAKLVSEYLN